MKTITHVATLFYYDGAQVFEARDAIGGHYVAVMMEPIGEQERYLVAGVEPDRLRQFRSGMIDLRSLLTHRTEAEWYLGTELQGPARSLMIELQSSPLPEDSFLPDDGFVLHDHPADATTLRTARERHNLVMELAIDPPEAAEEHRIHVGTLVGVLAHVQTMVKHAYSWALRELTPSQRKVVDRADAHLLDVVVPAAAGSFRVVLEAAKGPDLLGHNELARALERVDSLFERIVDPEQALAAVKAHRGHLAGAFLRLLRFLVQSNSGLRYAWAEPDFAQPRSGQVTAGEAGPLVDLLSGVSNLGAETVVILGALKKADVDSGAWRIASNEGEFSGKIKEGGPSLAGLRLESSYRFTCMEEIEELEVLGREQRTLYLIEHQPA